MRLIIENHFDNFEILETKNGNIALNQLKQHVFNIVVLDLKLPNTDTLSLISNMRVRQEDIPILIFSMVSEYAFLKPYLNSGINVYLNKQAENQEVVLAIEMLLKGKKYFSRDIPESIAEDKLFFKQADGNPLKICRKGKWKS